MTTEANPGGPGARADEPIAGRHGTLDEVGAWLSEASAGRFRLVLLSGEPGIGKTRLLRSVCSRPGHARTKVVSTSCPPPGAAPRAPIREMTTALDPGSAAGAAVPLVADSDAVDHRLVAEDAHQLLQLLERASVGHGIVVAVDDLHWATRHTIATIENVAARLEDLSATRQVPVALVLTERFPPAGPHSDAWSRLARLDSSRGLRLLGLSELGIVEFVTGFCGAPPDPRLLGALQRSTGGNPLHLATLLRRLQREERLAVTTSRVSLSGTDPLPATGQLSNELGSAIDRLSDPASRLAEYLAVLGSAADTEVLSSFAGPPERGGSLTELLEAGLATVDGDRVSLVHSVLQSEIDNRMGDRRRSKLHATAADALLRDAHSGPEEQGSADPDLARAWRISELSDDTAIAIAHHLDLAGEHADRSIMGELAEKGATAAMGSGAWSDAARFWSMAAAVAPRSRAARTHLLAGRSAYLDLDPESCRKHLGWSIEAARADGDMTTWGEALVQLLRNNLVYETGSIGRRWDTREAHDFLEQAERTHPELCARMLDVLANIAFAELRPDEGEDMARRGLKILDGHDSTTEGMLLFTLGLHSLGRLDLEQAETFYRSSQTRLANSDDPFQRGWVRGRLALLEAMRGRRDRAVEQAEAAATTDRNASSWAEYSMTSAVRSQLAAFAGDFAKSERLGHDAEVAWQRSNFYITPGILFPTLAAVRSLRGDIAGARGALDDMATAGARGSWRYRLMVEWLCGDRESVRRNVADRTPAAPADATLLNLGSIAIQAELAVAVQSRDMAARIRPVLEEVFANGVRTSPGWPSSIPRLLCGCASLTGDAQDAKAWLPVAAQTAESLESPVERSLVALERARLLIREGEAEAAGPVLEECVVTFDRLGMLPLRAAAIDLLAKIRDSAVASRPSAVTRYILFTDICSSTQLNRELGDEQWLQVVAEHNRVVRRRLREFDGVEVKQTGDGMFAWFSDPGRAIRCARAAVSDMERMNPSRARAVHLRAGVSAGEPLPMDGDLYGLSIAEAARICDAAEPGRVLAGSDVISADPNPPSFRDIGTRDLKGLEPGLRLVELDPDDAATPQR